MKRDNLTLEDIIEFSKLTASSADDCVREIDGLLEQKGAKEKELEELIALEETLPVEDRVRNQRTKDKIRKSIRDLEQHIEAATERGLILERSCDVNQEVASQLEGKPVNYRTERRLAEKGDIEEDVKELRGRLASKERRKAVAGEIKSGSFGKKLLWWLLAIIAIIIIILLLLRNCGGGGPGSIKRSVYRIFGIDSDEASDGSTSQYNRFGFSGDSSPSSGSSSDGSEQSGSGRSSRQSFSVGGEGDGDDSGEGTSERNRFGFDSTKPDGLSDDGSGSDALDSELRRRNQVSSEEWRRNYTGKIVRDDMVTIPYKDPAIPFDDMEIEYYLLEGDFASGFNTVTGSLLDSRFGSRDNVSIDQLIAAYEEEHGMEEAPAAAPSIAEQLAAEDKRRALKLDPDDDFYSIDIANKGTSKKEIIEKMIKESPYVEMESEGVPVELSAGIHPWTARFSAGGTESMPDSSWGLLWPAGIDAAAHYKFVNEVDKQVGAGLRIGAYANPVDIVNSIAGAQDASIPLDVPVMAELKGKFGAFEGYVGAGLLGSMGPDVAWDGGTTGQETHLFGFGPIGVNPAAELGLGASIPLSDEHSSISFGVDSVVGFNPRNSWNPQKVLVSPYVRYENSLDTFNPVDNYYYDIGIVNDDAKPSDYGYDILIENDDAEALKRREEEKKPENIIAQRLASKGLDARDDYYPIRIDNEAVAAVKREEKVGGLSETVTEAAVAALMAGDTQSYNIILNEDAASAADRNRIINEYYNRYQFYEYDKMNNDWLAAQDQSNNAKLRELYGDDSAVPGDEVSELNRNYIAEETYEGTPIDLEFQISPYSFGLVNYFYKVSFVKDQSTIGKEDSASTNVFGLTSYRPRGGWQYGISLGMKWRVVNNKEFQFFVGARGMFQHHAFARVSGQHFYSYMLFGEVGIGFFGLNVYLGAGFDFSGAYGMNIGFAAMAGIDYTLMLAKGIGITAGANFTFAIGSDDNAGGNIGSTVIQTVPLSINPYLGMRIAFDGRVVKYKDEVPSANRQYKILVDRGDDDGFEDPLDGMTFDDLENPEE